MKTNTEPRKNKKKHLKTSKFRGISFRRGLWRSQYKQIKFEGYFQTEMEALAHFMTAYCCCGLNPQEKRDKMLLLNDLEKGRMALDEYKQIDDDFVHRFAIDKKHVVCVNESSYIKYKDWFWFVRFGRVMGITSFKMIDKKCVFGYSRLEDLIYFDKIKATEGTYKVGDFSPAKANGDCFDLRFKNLIEPDNLNASQCDGFNPLSQMVKL